MGKSSTFQLVLLVVFGFFGVIALLAFSGFVPLPGGSQSQFGGQVTVWGTINQGQFDAFLSQFNQTNQSYFNVAYKQKSAVRFEEELVSALAAGNGPDLVIIPSDIVVSEMDKLYPMPLASFSARQFQDTFVDGTGMFWTSQGALAMPLFVDPLVTYWNKDIYSSAGIASVPKTWGQVATVAKQLTKRDDRGNVAQSAFAMGSAKNVAHAKEIISALFLQSGSKMVGVDNSGHYVAVLRDSASAGENVASALRFYTDFVSPTKAVYSWNSALPLSTDAFISGSLATYFGFASEYSAIRERNPHLNFDVAALPQVDNATAKKTFGRMYAIGAVKNSKNVGTALTVALALSSASPSQSISALVGLPPLRRDALSVAAGNSILDVFNKSAITSVAWLDPRESETRQLFADMIESVIIGRSSENEAISLAQSQMTQLFPTQEQ